MLPRKIIAKKTRWIWIVFLILSPLAYAAGVVLILKHDPSAQIGVSIDRERAVSIGTEFAGSKGVNVHGWDVFFHFKPENDLLFYYRLRSGAERDLARQMAPESVIAIRFRSPDKKENIEVQLTPDGRVLGFLRNISRTIEFVDPGEETAMRIAQQAAKARLAAMGVSQPVELKPGESSGVAGQVRRYIWRWPLASLPELNLEGRLSVRGGELVGDQITASVDRAFAKRSLHSGSTLRVVSILLYALVILIAVILGVYRFVQRARQKEVSYSRVFLLTLVFTIVASSFILITDLALYDITGTPDFPAPDLVILFSASMIYLLVALFLGLAYGSGEGDIREAYPGKLSSLDALLTGKIFSRNVARSVVSGWAFGGWILLCTNAFLFPWQSNPTYGEELGPLDAWFSNAPWLGAFIGWPMDVILVAVIGLLIPLPLFRRRFRSSKIIILLLSFFMWVACSGPYLNFRPWSAILLMAAIRTFFAQLAFFKFDLLTAITGLASPTFISFVVGMMAQPSQSLRLSGAISLSIALAVLAIELIFAFKGRIYRDDEVRPVYAKNLAERLSMLAEVTAARETQKRLMPEELPQTSHFSIAASCLPAFEVGGDYYDLFEIEPGKLGVLIAEGGGKGLGSALSIAFAKGYLMPKIMGGKASDDSPAEIIRGLQDRLNQKLDEGAKIGIGYAVIDATDSALRYARTADYPLIMVDRQSASEKLIQPKERVIKFKSNLGGKEDVSLIEGSLSLNPGDSVIFFTDGIARNWINNGSSPETEFAKVLTVSRNESSAKLQEALTKAINESSKIARKKGSEDDLTAVVVKLEKPEADFEAVNDLEKS